MTLTQITEKGIKDGEIVNADINASAAIAKSKLASLDIVNGDINASAAIAKSKLASLDVVNADINASAAIARSKIAEFVEDNVNDRVLTATGLSNTLQAESKLLFTSSGGDPVLTITGSSTAGHAQLNLKTGGTTDHGSINFGDNDDDDAGEIRYTHSTNLLAFDTNGTPKMVIDSNGKVGIGTTSPTTNLHLGASGADQKRSIKIDGTNGSSELQGVILESDGETAKFHIKTGIGGGTPTEKLTILGSSGNVGIGNTSPQGELHVGVADNSSHEAMLILNNGGASGQEAGIEWRYENITTPRAKIHVNSSDQILRFSTADNEAMRIDTTQKVGIGTTSVYSILDVNDSSTDGYPFGTAVTGQYSYLPYSHELNIKNTDKGSSNTFTGIHFHAGEHATNGYNSTARISAIKSGNYKADLAFGTRNSSFKERMRLTAEGKLLIATTDGNPHANADELTLGDPSGTVRGGMTINSGANKDGSIHFGDPDSNSSGQINYDHNTDAISFYTDNTKRIRIDSHGLKFGLSTGENDALNDYEEGTWTPVIKTYSNNTWVNASMTSTGTVSSAKYTKIGNICHLHLNWNSFDIDNASYCVMGDLPFTSASSGGGFGGITYSNAFGNQDFNSPYVGGSTTIIEFYRNGNNWNSWNTDSSRYLNMGITYMTA